MTALSRFSLLLFALALSQPASAEGTKPAASAAAPAAGDAAPSADAPAEAEADPENPHPGFGAKVPPDENAAAEDLPRGTIEAVILDGKNAPLAKHKVRLGIMFQKISEGESRSERFAVTDDAGRARFDGLTVASEYSYRVTVESGPAEYRSFPFNLTDKSGNRVKLHVFPVTTTLHDAPILMSAYAYVEPRDETFMFDVGFQIYNVGAMAWVPQDVIMKLPEGFKAFNSQRDMNASGFDEVEGVGGKLRGTFGPGQHRVGFTFQMPKSGRSSASFQLGFLPRVLELRVLAEASSSVRLAVSEPTNLASENFGSPKPEPNRQGKRLLATDARFPPSDLSASVSIELDGLPVPGPGRWIAVLVAGALATLGLAAFRGVVRLDSSNATLRDQDLETARELLLSEIVDVERARQRGSLGPRAYADARTLLLDALSRLGRDILMPAKKKRRRAAAA